MDKYMLNQIKAENNQIYELANPKAEFNYILFKKSFMVLVLYIKLKTVYKPSINYLYKFRNKINLLKKYKSSYYALKEVWIKPKSGKVIINKLL
jgi:hypothetical protein